VDAGAGIAHTVVLPGCRIGAGARIQNAILAENCQIPAGLSIGEDDVGDRARFGCSAGGIVVVTPAMIDRLKKIPARKPPLPYPVQSVVTSGGVSEEDRAAALGA
jgi:ADP-glucose pyrophosphorylase